MQNDITIQKPLDSDTQYEKVQRINLADSIATRDEIGQTIAANNQERDNRIQELTVHYEKLNEPLEEQYAALDKETTVAQKLGVITDEVIEPAPVEIEPAPVEMPPVEEVAQEAPADPQV